MATLNSNHIHNYSNSVEYENVQQMVNDRVPISTQIHNQVMAKQASRRKKVTIREDDGQNRKEKVRKRLQEKLKKKKSN